MSRPITICDVLWAAVDRTRRPLLKATMAANKAGGHFSYDPVCRHDPPCRDTLPHRPTDREIEDVVSEIPDLAYLFTDG